MYILQRAKRKNMDKICLERMKSQHRSILSLYLAFSKNMKIIFSQNIMFCERIHGANFSIAGTKSSTGIIRDQADVRFWKCIRFCLPNPGIDGMIGRRGKT